MREKLNQLARVEIMKDEIMDVSERVVNHITRDEYGKISMEISQESATQLIMGLCRVAGQVSERAVDVVARIYSEALARQEFLEIKSMENEAEIMRRFNDQVDECLKNLDLKDTAMVNNFGIICEQLRRNLLAQFPNKQKVSLLDKIFRRG